MSSLYPKGMEAILSAFMVGGSQAVTLKVVAVSNAYVYSATHTVFGDLGATTYGDSITLTNVIHVGGVVDADDVTLTGLTVGEIINAAIVFATWAGGSALLAYIDSESSPTFPVNVRATTAEIAWDAAGIFQI